jgi:hypothetical protein
VTAGTGYYRITYKIGTGTETEIVTEQAVTETDYTTKTHNLPSNIRGSMGEDVTVFFYFRVGNSANTIYMCNRLMVGDQFHADWNPYDAGYGEGVLAIGAANPAPAKGSVSVRSSIVTAQAHAIEITLSASLNALAYSTLEGFLYLEDIANVIGDIVISVFSGSNYAYRTISISKGRWRDFKLDLGYKSEASWILTGTIDWTAITKIRFFSFASASANWLFAIDGFHFDSNRFSGSASNSDSSNAWGVLKRPPEIDDALDSDVECLAKAEGILALYKDPLVNLRNVKLQEGQKVNVGETVEIIVSTPALDLTVRLMSITHVFSGTEWEATCELSNEPIEFNYLIKQQDERIKLATRGIAK